MHPLRLKRLLIVAGLITACGLVVSLALYALNQNINLYYLPSQLAQAKIPVQTSFRLGGLVKKVEKHGLNIQFIVTDSKSERLVNYRGVLPDLFREGQGVVVEGKLDEQGIMQGTLVLAKHDENYHPPNLDKLLKDND